MKRSCDEGQWGSAPSAPGQQGSPEKCEDSQQGPFRAAVQQMPKVILAFLQLGFIFVFIVVFFTWSLQYRWYSWSLCPVYHCIITNTVFIALVNIVYVHILSSFLLALLPPLHTVFCTCISTRPPALGSGCNQGRMALLATVDGDAASVRLLKLMQQMNALQ